MTKTHTPDSLVLNAPPLGHDIWESIDATSQDAIDAHSRAHYRALELHLLERAAHEIYRMAQSSFPKIHGDSPKNRRRTLAGEESVRRRKLAWNTARELLASAVETRDIAQAERDRLCSRKTSN